MTSPTATAEIERLAREATPGSWRASSNNCCNPTAVAIEVNLACINGLSAWFSLARLEAPEEAEIGYTDGTLHPDSAKANAAYIAAVSPDVVLGLIERAKQAEATEREACAKLAEDLADTIGRFMAAGWRGNPNMSGDDRDFMPADMRRKHDVKARAVVDFIAIQIRARSHH